MILDGKSLAKSLRKELKQEVAAMDSPPGLAVVLVGDDPASHVYVTKKGKACKRIGITSEIYKLPAQSSQEEVLELIQELNDKETIHGILVQLPLPKHLDSAQIIEAINPVKDVDGLHPTNMGYLLSGKPRLVPCTPLGIMKLLEHYEIALKGKNAVIIGRSNLVGKPISLLLLQEHATTTICHSRTLHLPQITRSADVLVVAAGQPHMIHRDMVKPGTVIIDVGIHRVENKLIGDVDFDSVQSQASYITPVPGGVGPMTVAMLLHNTVKAAKAIKG